MSDYATRASLLLRLKSTDDRPRELAWEEFQKRYTPIIAGFCRNLGAKPQEVDDIIQDVMLGFFNAQPTFTYDPARGRFRGYLKTCVVHALQARRRKNPASSSSSVEEIDPMDPSVEKAWSKLWAQELLKRAVELTREQYRDNPTFKAFELSVMQGRSVEETAQLTGLGVESVYKAKQRVSEAMRKHLSVLEDEEG